MKMICKQLILFQNRVMVSQLAVNQPSKDIVGPTPTSGADVGKSNEKYKRNIIR